MQNIIEILLWVTFAHEQDNKNVLYIYAEKWQVVVCECVFVIEFNMLPEWI